MDTLTYADLPTMAYGELGPTSQPGKSSLLPSLISPSQVSTSNNPFTPWIIKHKDLLLPILGDSKISERLNEIDNHTEIYPYEVFVDQPSGIRAHLKFHQLEGVSFLCHLRKNNAHGILGDEMGLGKTLQTLSFFQHLVNTEGHHDKRPFLVVCPLSVLGMWISETKEWTSLRVVQYYGSQEKRKEVAKAVRGKETDVMVTTYETLISDGQRLNRMGTWRAIVLDEGHKIRNANKKNALSVSRLKTEQRIILTGTPIQNNLSETWAMLKWLYPEVFDTPETCSAFRRAFALAEGKVDPRFIHDVRKFLEVIMLRRVKDTPGLQLDLPPKTEVILYAPLTRIQRLLYREIVTGVQEDCAPSSPKISNAFTPNTPPRTPTNNFRNFIEDEFPSSPSTSSQYISTGGPGRAVLNSLMELRKICTHPLILNRFEGGDDDESELDVVATSSKFIILKKLLENVVIKDEKKVLIFSSFDRGLNCCEFLLEDLNINFLRLDGSTPAAMRRYGIHLFAKDADYKVFLIATRAGGEGITLTAAEVVVFLDLDWNPQLTRQAESRAHRIGQTRPVTVYKLCTRGTVEEQMISRLNKKLYLDAKVNAHFVNSTSPVRTAFTEPFHTDTDTIRNLVNRSMHTFAVDQTHGEDMLGWQWERIVEYCQATENVDQYDEMATPVETPISPGPTDEEKERIWLKQNERIQTNVFDGVKVLRSPSKSTFDSEGPPRGKRIIKSRTIYNKKIDHFISKESMLCGRWEAVPTLTGKNPNSEPKTPTREAFVHQKNCVFCGGTKRITECFHCPRVFHEKCMGKRKPSAVGKFFENTCPYHRCSGCLQTAYEAGGLLFLCNTCPRAFCVECIDLDKMLTLDDELAELQALGFHQPKYVKHITCGDCVKESAASLRSKRDASKDRMMRNSKRYRV